MELERFHRMDGAISSHHFVGSLGRAEPEGPQDWLPHTETVHYHRGEHIFGRLNPSESLYLVVQGMVKVSVPAGDNSTVLLDICQPEDFFGESAFVGTPAVLQTAVAMDDVTLMKWSVAEIERLVGERPKLAFALMQFLVRRNLDFAARIESFCSEPIPRRLARALLRFSDRFAGLDARQAVPLPSVMLPLTHGLLAQYVGTSREIVSLYMNRFRRAALLTYSRASVIVDRGALAAWLARESGAAAEENGTQSAAAPA